MRGAYTCLGISRGLVGLSLRRTRRWCSSAASSAAAATADERVPSRCWRVRCCTRSCRNCQSSRVSASSRQHDLRAARRTDSRTLRRARSRPGACAARRARAAGGIMRARDSGTGRATGRRAKRSFTIASYQTIFCHSAVGGNARQLRGQAQAGEAVDERRVDQLVGVIEHARRIEDPAVEIHLLDGAEHAARRARSPAACRCPAARGRAPSSSKSSFVPMNMQRAPRDSPSWMKATVASCFSSLVSNGKHTWLLCRTSDPATGGLMPKAPLLPPVNDS